MNHSAFVALSRFPYTLWIPVSKSDVVKPHPPAPTLFSAARALYINAVFHSLKKIMSLCITPAAITFVSTT